jgi:hypothetical protein
MQLVTLTGQHYGFSEEALAIRAMNLISSRGITTLTGAQTTLSNLAFTAGGWTLLKRVIAELIIGSIAFPADLSADGASLAPGMTEQIIGTRDVSSAVT